ncbi:RpiB/LacA/LacB family sugar-phosphate isomerase [Enteractinococcus helveticum]|jgi:ribose 5-phosphate isomerase B|uniref:D-erythrulose-4-phosphate isomerase 1 n=1 Tax=Enteractinococcus helveticum TaxID=1837282 RepID=A0A1B7LYL7_9MICC|nr:RpiB/LacA/LacB family sugar-phosphate isomerase [Enteractinococcus helveticum]OAV60490.1 D-erythrulose-4-phosphate isomerase 1 [Enteractinococcus helveticum]
MRFIIGAPPNGAALKEELKSQLEGDDRVSTVIDLSTKDITYPEVSFQAAQVIVEGKADRGILVCGTGVGTAIAASKVPGIRAATAHDLVTVRGSIENYNAQILCMGQNVITPTAAKALVDLWLTLRHDSTSNYGKLLDEIDAYEAR